MANNPMGLLANVSLSADAEQPRSQIGNGGRPAGKPARWENSPIPVGICYAGCMFVCGNVLIGIGDALVEIATKNGIDMADTGWLFLARGAGQILATLFCADLYASFWGNGILMVCTFIVAALWIVGALIAHAGLLYLWFFMTGLMTATLDIGTQILTRRAYGSEAGPWLTANTFCFATAGLLAPLVDYATETLLQQCAVYASFAVALGLLTFLITEDNYLCLTKMQLDDDAGNENLSVGEKIQRSLFAWLDPVYRNDALLALMIFFTIGGQNMMSNYLETYILITGVTPVDIDSLMLSIFWGSMVISRLVAMFKLQPGLQTKPLIGQMKIMFIGCMIAAVPLALSPNLMGQADNCQDTPERCAGPEGYCWIEKYGCFPIEEDDTTTTCIDPSASSSHAELINTRADYGNKDTEAADNAGPKQAVCGPGCTYKPGAGNNLKESDTLDLVGGIEYDWSPNCLMDANADGEEVPHHAYWPLFAGYLIYGFFVGPILGYIFDFHNRVTVSKERGSAILILGLNLGSSLVPWLFTLCLQFDLEGASMPVVQIISVIAPAMILAHVVGLNKDMVNAPPGAAGAPAPAPAPAPVVRQTSTGFTTRRELLVRQGL